MILVSHSVNLDYVVIRRPGSVPALWGVAIYKAFIRLGEHHLTLR